MAGDLLHMNHVNRLEEGGLPGTIVEQKKFTKNGTYWAPNGVAYSPVIVKVPQPEMTETTVTRNGTYTPPPNGAFSKVTVNVPSSGGQIQDVASLPDPSTLAEGDILHLSREAVGTPDTWYMYGNIGSGFYPLYFASLDSISLDQAFTWVGNRFIPIYSMEPGISAFSFDGTTIKITVGDIDFELERGEAYDVHCVKDAGITSWYNTQDEPYTMLYVLNVDDETTPLLDRTFAAHARFIEPGSTFLTSVEKFANESYPDTFYLKIQYSDGRVKTLYPEEYTEPPTFDRIEDINEGFFTKQSNIISPMQPPAYSFTFYRNADGTVDLGNDYLDATTGFIINHFEYGSTEYSWGFRTNGYYSEGLSGYYEGQEHDGTYVDCHHVSFNEHTKVGFGIIAQGTYGIGWHPNVFVPCPYRIIDK